MVKEKGAADSSEYTRYLKQISNQRLAKSDVDTQQLISSRVSIVSNSPFGQSSQNSLLYRFRTLPILTEVEFYIINSVIADRSSIYGITFDNNGFLYFIESVANRFNRLNLSTGVLTTLITGSPLNQANGIDFDQSNNCIYIANSSANNILRYNLTTSQLDGSPYVGTGLLTPRAVKFFNGLLYICDTGNRRIKTFNGTTLTTIAGTGSFGFNGDGAASSRAIFPTDLIFVKSTLYFVDNFKSHRIRMLKDGTITTVAGSATTNNDGGYSGDGGLATNAQLNSPTGLSYSSETNSIVFTDSDNHRIRAVSLSTGIITTIAGTGVSGFTGNGGNSLDARLRGPKPVIVYNNNIYIGDQDSNLTSTIRVLNPRYKTTNYF